ncbi:hypothetical protein [Halocalculus aciditolerans]|uniref:Uncharacterized protein n=1 Tax=Halocalculus aciditolerans TaxID=1383812 RepID=A0A830F586_9EURY|nr:hypothetical protein [Halocalculus aciditolerans]GGL64300.1 hypothetical protein GCM10009039_22690 [Halocalculus aciditolerans]
MALTHDDIETIRLYERYDRGELTEREARNALGNEIIDGLAEEAAAFRAATKRDTAELLVDGEALQNSGETERPDQDHSESG